VADRLNVTFEGLVRFQVIRWEDELYSSTRSFQEQIDTAAGMAEVDILFCILWGRIGLKLNSAAWQLGGRDEYESGTTYEYEVALALNKKNGGVPDLYLFRKSSPILYRADYAEEDIEQHRVLETVWKRWTLSDEGYNTAGYQTFAETDEFEQQIEDCLRRWLELKGVLVSGPVWDRRVNGSPFCGLSPFDPSHSSLFFGREAAIASIISKIRTSRFLLIVGASGTGKSSLLRAGLVPRLARPGVVPDIDHWRVSVLAPSTDPFLDLAEALADEACLGLELKQIGYTGERLAAILRQGGDAALALLQSALDRAAQARAAAQHYKEPRPARILLAIDQLERLFIEARRDQIEPFAILLRALMMADFALIIVTLRSDAYGNFQSVEAFCDLREAGATHDLLPPNVLELEDIINRPITACYPPLTFEIEASGKSLAQQLVKDATGSDSLPLLQMTLESLFQAEGARNDGVLRFSDYGGMEQAVIRVASEAFAAIDSTARANVPALITAFVQDMSLDPVTTQRSVTLRPIVRAIFERDRPGRTALVEAFIAHRLLTVEEFAGEIRIRPVHEALLRVWPEAVRILTENENIIRVRRTLEPLVEQWIHTGQTAESDILLSSPALLAGGQQLLDRVGDDVDPWMRDYILASLAAEARRAAEELQRRTEIFSATGGMRAQSIPYYRLVAAILLGLVIFIRIENPPMVEWLSSLAFDTYQRISPNVQKSRPVVIVDIDESSLKQFGQWPWPRTVVADLVINLHNLGALVIGFDIVFSDADRTSPKLVAKTSRYLDAETRDKLSRLPSNDIVFADAIKRSGHVVVSRFGIPTPTENPNAGYENETGFAFVGEEPEPFLLSYLGLSRNVDSIEQAAAGRGLISIRPERDGIVRRLPLISKAAGLISSSLSLEMLRVVTGSSTIMVNADNVGVRWVGVRGLKVPTDRNGQLWIYWGHHDPGRFVSAADVLNGRAPVDRIKQRLVLIGSSAGGLNDISSTSVDAAVPGVEIHAQAIENMLTKSMLIRPDMAPTLELLLVIVIGLTLSIVMPLLSARTLVALSALILIVVVGGGWIAFRYWRLLIDPIYPVLTTVIFITVMTFHIYRYSEAQRAGIRRFFDKRLKIDASKK